MILHLIEYSISTFHAYFVINLYFFTLQVTTAWHTSGLWWKQCDDGAGSLQPTSQLQRKWSDGVFSGTTRILSEHARKTNQVRDQGVDASRSNKWLRERLPNLHRTHYDQGWRLTCESSAEGFDGADRSTSLYRKNWTISSHNPTFFTDLQEKGIYARGTVRMNRRHFRRDSLPPKCMKDQGDTKVIQNGPLVAKAWRDKKMIHLLMTLRLSQFKSSENDETGRESTCYAPSSSPSWTRTWMVLITRISYMDITCDVPDVQERVALPVLVCGGRSRGESLRCLQGIPTPSAASEDGETKAMASSGVPTGALQAAYRSGACKPEAEVFDSHGSH